MKSDLELHCLLELIRLETKENNDNRVKTSTTH